MEEWEKLKQEILARINFIDSITPMSNWTSKEPDWWLEMVTIKCLIKGDIK